METLNKLLDKSWRTSQLYKIRNKQKELVTFHRNRVQQHYQLHKWSRNIILKSRQLGFTTEESIDSLDDALFNRNTECLLIAHNLDAGKKIFDGKIDLAWKNLHPNLKQLYKVDANTAQTLKFEFGDGSYSSIAVDTNGRSGTYNRVHITEFADVCKKYPNKVKDILEGTIPAVPTNGRVDIESTSQGASGEFYDMFMQAWERGEPKYPVEYKAHFYNWQWDEEIDNVLPETNLPDKFKEYQKIHKLNDQEITFYYTKWLSLNQDWNSLHKEYPTTPEEAFEVIIEGSYYGVAIGQMERDGRITIVPHDKALKVHTAWDLGIGSNLVVGFYQRTREGQLRRIDSWQGKESDGMPEAIEAVLKKPYIYGNHFAPHDIQTTDIGSGKTRIDTARQLGIKFSIVPDIGLDDGINVAQLALNTLWVDKEHNKDWLTAMRSYCREWDDKRGTYKDDAYHNWASHYADEFRMAAISASKMLNETKMPNRPFRDVTVEIWNGDNNV